MNEEKHNEEADLIVKPFHFIRNFNLCLFRHKYLFLNKLFFIHINNVFKVISVQKRSYNETWKKRYLNWTLNIFPKTWVGLYRRLDVVWSYVIQINWYIFFVLITAFLYQYQNFFNSSFFTFRNIIIIIFYKCCCSRTLVE